MKKIDQLTHILLNLYKNPHYFENFDTDRQIWQHANLRESALAQQAALESGLKADQLLRIWLKHRDTLPDQAKKLKDELPEGHILRKVLAEHEMTLCFVADLDEMNERIQKMTYASSSTMEIRRVAHVSSHLIHVEQHREREEQVIFPQLRLKGFYSLSSLITEQHLRITNIHYQLRELVWNVDSMSFDHFKSQLNRLVSVLVPMIRQHIFIENNVLFPLAMEVLDEPRTWEKMKEICDEIGYCGYDGR